MASRNLVEPAPLAEQRETLRRQLRAQRQQIARQLSPAVAGAYPRSMTMRFFMQQPALATQLAVGLATLLMGARFIKSITAALSVAQLVRSTTAAVARPAPARTPHIPRAAMPEMDLLL